MPPQKQEPQATPEDQPNQPEGDPEPSARDQAIAAIEQSGDPDTGAEPPPEPEPDPETPGPEDLLAAVAEERASLQAEKKKLAAKEQDVDEKIKEMDAFMGRVKDDPFEFMKEVAGDNWYFDATQRFLNKGQPTKEQKEQRLEQRIAALEEQNRKLSEQRDQEKVQVEAEKRSAAYMGNLQAELSKPEYAIVSNDPSAVNELIQLVTGYARDNQGELLPAEDALGRIKTAQLERLKKLQATEAWAAEFGAAQESPQKPKPRPAPIVTNDPPHRASPPTEGEDDDLTPVERRERAAQAVLASLQGS